jgi:hypothetical protein
VHAAITIAAATTAMASLIRTLDISDHLLLRARSAGLVRMQRVDV